MSNPAKYLAEFFERESGDQHGESLFTLLKATVQLENELDARERMSVRVDHFRLVLPEIRNALRQNQSNDLIQIVTRFSGGASRPCEIDPRSLSLLHVVSDMIDVDDFATDSSIDAIRKLLEGVKATVIADESLDANLRLYISNAIIAVEHELAMYEITGDFNLREALLTLIGLMRTAEAESDDSTRWTKVWEQWGVPVVQGLIVSTPQLALGVGQFFQSIQK